MDRQPAGRVRGGPGSHRGPAGPAPLSATERVSTAIVRVIRHPLFPVAYITGTAVWWSLHPPANGWVNAFHDDAYPWPLWTAAASLLALLIESAVGIGQYYAAKRDAVQSARTAELMRAMSAQSDAIAVMLAEVREAMRAGTWAADPLPRERKGNRKGRRERAR